MPAQSWAALVESADVSDNKVLEPGEYDVELKSAKEKKSNAGDLMFNCRYQVINGPEKGATVWDNIVILSDPDKANALRMNLRKLFTLGADKDFLAAEPSPTEIINKIEGSRLTVTLEIREWNGQEQNNVKSFKKLEGDAVAAPKPRAKAEPEPAEADDDAPEVEEKPKATKAKGKIPLPPAP